jgi:sec-independent protein translocase protein TatA
MFGSIGMPELIVVFVIALVVFGPRRLPEIGHSLGRAIAEFKRATNELQRTLEEEVRAEDARANAAASSTSPVDSAAAPSHQDATVSEKVS